MRIDQQKELVRSNSQGSEIDNTVPREAGTWPVPDERDAACLDTDDIEPSLGDDDDDDNYDAPTPGDNDDDGNAPSIGDDDDEPSLGNDAERFSSSVI